MTLRIKVIPRSKKNEVSGEMADGTVKVHVTAPPEKGRANEQVCVVLAAHYKVPVRSVEIVSGHSNPRKLVRIDLEGTIRTDSHASAKEQGRNQE
ncbi:MAG: DUF167 domain-containing protein [Acidobacteriia bacterium]|nr:DUF167 domain-containing protein [Terriglobia bacterium]